MKEKINKKQLLLALTAVCLVGLIGVGISYAYYVANFQVKNPENGNNNVTSASTTNVVMDINSKTVAFDGVLPGHKEVKAFTIRGEGDKNAQPTEASIKVIPNLGVFSNDVTWKLYKSTEEVTCTSTQKHVNGQYYEESSCNIPSSATLELSGGAGEEFKNIIVYPKTETKYYLVVEYANQGDQSNQQGQEFTINLDLGGKGVLPTFVEKITKLAQSDTVNFASDDYPDYNIRYIGANPNNYVYFNCSDYSNQSDSTCEKWRIIGLFNNITDSDGDEKDLIKIIRDDSLGNLYWDYKKNGVGSSTIDYIDNGSNDWSDSQLMMMLNPVDYLKSGYTNSNDIISYNNQELYSKMGSYYNGTEGCKPAEIAKGDNFNCEEIDFTTTGLKNDSTRDAIENVVWNLGGSSVAFDQSYIHNNIIARDYYELERGTTVYSGRPTTWTGKIGLMYPSDYGYATSGGQTTDRETCLEYPLMSWDGISGEIIDDCKKNNYLFKSYEQWTLAPLSYTDPYVFYVELRGGVYINNAGAAGTIGVRPALFLKSYISISGGTGSSTEPYQLKLY